MQHEKQISLPHLKSSENKISTVNPIYAYCIKTRIRVSGGGDVESQILF